MSNRYEIKTIEDIVECTNADNIDDFLVDLRNHVEIVREFKKLIDLEVRGTTDYEKKGLSTMIWIDDDKHDTEIVISMEDK